MGKVKEVREEYNIDDTHYRYIVQLMDRTRKAIDNHEECYNREFEEEMLRYIPTNESTVVDHHAVKEILQAFAEDGKWREVYKTLYANEKSEQAVIESIYGVKE